MEIQNHIKLIGEEIIELLLEKNKAYGNSAADPLRVFSKVDRLEQLNVRIDDKLSRIAKGSAYGNEDTELDLIGYLILKRAVKAYQQDQDQAAMAESMEQHISASIGNFSEMQELAFN